MFSNPIVRSFFEDNSSHRELERLFTLSIVYQIAIGFLPLLPVSLPSVSLVHRYNLAGS